MALFIYVNCVSPHTKVTNGKCQKDEVKNECTYCTRGIVDRHRKLLLAYVKEGDNLEDVSVDA